MKTIKFELDDFAQLEIKTAPIVGGVGEISHSDTQCTSGDTGCCDEPYVIADDWKSYSSFA